MFRLIGLYVAILLAACNGGPAGEEAYLEVRWWIYGQPADADWCDLAGIETVQLVEDDDPLEDFSWPCADGVFTDVEPRLAEGEYFIRFEGLDAGGYSVAATPDPSDSPPAHLTVREGDRIVLDEYDLDAGHRGSLVVPLLFESSRGAAVSCEAAGVERVGWEFFIDACGAPRGRGEAVHADVSGGGVVCADASLTLAEIPLGVYSVHVVAFAAGAEWAVDCGGLALRDSALEAEPCVVTLLD